MMFCRADAMKYKSDPLKRFHEQYVPEPNSGCWIWVGRTNKAGYGQLKINYKKYLAHRFIMGLHLSKDKAKCVLHKCDNPSCVNPDHLFVGSRKDNAIDKVKKGRHPRICGERLKGKLKADQVLEIRADTRTYRVIAKDYGVDSSTVSNIKNRKIWKHL